MSQMVKNGKCLVTMLGPIFHKYSLKKDNLLLFHVAIVGFRYYSSNFVENCLFLDFNY